MYVYGGFQGIILSDVLSFTPGNSKHLRHLSHESRKVIHYALLHNMISIKTYHHFFNLVPRVSSRVGRRVLALKRVGAWKGIRCTVSL